MNPQHALIATVLVLAGCTLDYEGLADPEGGGGATSGDGAGAATSTTSSSATSSTSTSTSSSVATASASGTGGAGEGGAGGDGGGGGAALPGETPCAGLALDFEDALPESLGRLWLELDEGQADLSTGDGTLVIAMDDDELGAIGASSSVLDGCSVTVPLLAIDPAEPQDGERTGAGISNGTIGIYVEVGQSDDMPYCEVAVGSVDGSDADTTLPCGAGGPPRDLRLRHTGSALCFDAGPLGGPLVQVGECLDVDGPQKVVIGARTTNQSEVTFGPVR